ncbi:MAG TPA: FGGY-family carbohydrate kinase [Thermoleophilaceae bacterium]
MEAAEHYALAVDLGTGGPKVGLVSLTGKLAWFEHLRVHTRTTPDGGAEQDAAEWWELIGASARRGLDSGVVPRERVRAVAVTGQWASRIPVDDKGEPVGPCVMWMDTRGHRHSRDLVGGPVAGFDPRKLVPWVRRSGGVPSPNGADPISHLLYLQRDCPEVARAARWFLEPVDYLTMRFTGRASASPASMLATWLTDNRRLDREPVYDPQLVALAQVDKTKLPPLVPTGSVIGPVLDSVAAEIGLPPETQVVTGVPDLHAATVGAGAAGLYEPHLSISTTGWISCPLPRKKTDALRSMATVPGVGDGHYVLANSIDSAGVCLEWARDVLGAGDYPEMLRAAEAVPPGSNGVAFTPWLGGTRSPAEDRFARAGWHGMSLQTTQADLVRAVLEGVACHGRWLHEAVERFAKRRLEPVRIIGGGAQPDLWCQVHADVMGRTIERVEDPAGAVLRGAALLAAMGMGAVARNDLRELVAVDRVFTPEPGSRAVYDRLFAELPRLHKAQRGFHRRVLGEA